MTDEPLNEREVDPRDEREFNAKLELHTPSWFIGGNALISFRRVWDKRVDRFMGTVLEASGHSRRELETRVLEGDEFADLIGTAGRRAGERGDREYSDILSRLVGAALLDKAAVDKLTYIVDRIVRLEPVHVRILTAAHQAEMRDSEERRDIKKKNYRYKLSHDEDLEAWEKANVGVFDGVIQVPSLSTATAIDSGVIEACLSELAEQSFTLRTGGDFRPGDAARAALVAPIEWRLTSLGRSAANEIERVKRKLQ